MSETGFEGNTAVLERPPEPDVQEVLTPEPELPIREEQHRAPAIHIREMFDKTLKEVTDVYSRQRPKEGFMYKTARTALVSGLGVAVADSFHQVNKLNMAPALGAVAATTGGIFQELIRRSTGERAGGMFGRYANIEGKGMVKIGRLFDHGLERRVMKNLIGFHESKILKKARNYYFDPETRSIKHAEDFHGLTGQKRLRKYIRRIMQYEMAVDSIEQLGLHKTKKENEQIQRYRGGPQGTQLHDMIEAFLNLEKNEYRQKAILADCKQKMLKREKIAYALGSATRIGKHVALAAAFAGAGEWLAHKISASLPALSPKPIDNPMVTGHEPLPAILHERAASAPPELSQILQDNLTEATNTAKTGVNNAINFAGQAKDNFPETVKKLIAQTKIDGKNPKQFFEEVVNAGGTDIHNLGQEISERIPPIDIHLGGKKAA